MSQFPTMFPLLNHQQNSGGAITAPRRHPHANALSLGNPHPRIYLR